MEKLDSSCGIQVFPLLWKCLLSLIVGNATDENFKICKILSRFLFYLIKAKTWVRILSIFLLKLLQRSGTMLSEDVNSDRLNILQDKVLQFTISKENFSIIIIIYVSSILRSLAATTYHTLGTWITLKTFHWFVLGSREEVFLKSFDKHMCGNKLILCGHRFNFFVWK